MSVVSTRTVIEGNYSDYNLYQHGYPGLVRLYATTTSTVHTRIQEHFAAGECAEPDHRKATDNPSRV